MTEQQLLSIVREGLYLVLLVSAPPVLVSLLVGLVVNLFQATTQLQDHTLSFVPKLVAVLATLAISGPWIGAQLVRFARAVFDGIPLVR
ncbi:MAG: flagellar biosynthesis protein FliQ [Myxococcales bacterium]|nr:flagellar biosynthesis protein FliQ [Myxococcales bacterium]